MKKIKVVSLLGSSVLLLAACSDETEAVEEINEVNSSAIVSSENEENQESVASETEVEENIIVYNQLVEDNENFKATLLEIEYTYDDVWDEEKIEVRFDVENKRADSIEVQARSLSINGRMVDDSIQMMSQEVAAGKVAEAVLTLQDYEGNELPTLEGDLEMLLHVFSWEDMEYQEDVEVKVNFE